jgi:hypothetical protein
LTLNPLVNSGADLALLVLLGRVAEWSGRRWLIKPPPWLFGLPSGCHGLWAFLLFSAQDNE